MEKAHKQYKAAAFDFDLTLADSSKGILECFRYTLGEFGYPIPSDSDICATIGLPLVVGFDILTGIDMNPEREAMRQIYAKKGDEVMSRNTFFYPDTLTTLKALREKGIAVGIVSSKMRYRIEESFDMQLGERPYDILVGLDDVAVPKPDPEGLRFLMDKLGIEPAELLYVGDSYVDAETAVNAGVDFAGVTTGFTGKEKLGEYPNIIIAPSLSEIFREI